MALISMNFEIPCTPTVPTVVEVFNDITPLGYVFLSIAMLLCIFTFLIFVDEFYYIHVKVPYKTHKERLYWLIGLFPVFSWASLLGIVVPRSGVLVDFVASVYLSIVVFQFFQLIVEYFGGKSCMLEILSESKLNLRSPPLGCCCPCLPDIPFVKTNFNRIKAIVYQIALIRPILIFIAAVLWTDGSYTPGQLSLANAYLYLTILTTISTLLGMYGLIIIFRISKPHLREHNIVIKFISVQLVLIFSNLQGSVLELLTTKDIFPCSPPFSSKTRGLELNHMLLILECFLLATILHHYYRKEAMHSRIKSSTTISTFGDHNINNKSKNNSIVANNIVLQDGSTASTLSTTEESGENTIGGSPYPAHHTYHYDGQYGYHVQNDGIDHETSFDTSNEYFAPGVLKHKAMMAKRLAREKRFSDPVRKVPPFRFSLAACANATALEDMNKLRNLHSAYAHHPLHPNDAFKDVDHENRINYKQLSNHSRTGTPHCINDVIAPSQNLSFVHESHSPTISASTGMDKNDFLQKSYGNNETIIQPDIIPMTQITWDSHRQYDKPEQSSQENFTTIDESYCDNPSQLQCKKEKQYYSHPQDNQCITHNKGLVHPKPSPAHFFRDLLISPARKLTLVSVLLAEKDNPSYLQKLNKRSTTKSTSKTVKRRHYSVDEGRTRPKPQNVDCDKVLGPTLFAKDLDTNAKRSNLKTTNKNFLSLDDYGVSKIPTGVKEVYDNFGQQNLEAPFNSLKNDDQSKPQLQKANNYYFNNASLPSPNISNDIVPLKATIYPSGEHLVNYGSVNSFPEVVSSSNVHRNFNENSEGVIKDDEWKYHVNKILDTHLVHDDANKRTTTSSSLNYGLENRNNNNNSNINYKYNRHDYGQKANSKSVKDLPIYKTPTNMTSLSSFINTYSKKISNYRAMENDDNMANNKISP